jgi:hypothetical protein
MPETLEKLSPDRDLQCFFFHPSAIAALSATSPGGFTVSGTWRQQFDWAVIEWNRHNVYEHPALRNLPDGDLSGLVLSYEETRTNCVFLDSALFPTVDWPFLRVWAGDNGNENIYYIPLAAHATPVAGSYQCAYADFTLSGTVTAGDYVGLAFLEEHYTYLVLGSDTLTSIVQAIAASVNAFSAALKASSSGSTIRLYYTNGQSIASSTAGANGNRFGVYSYVSGSGSEAWDAVAKTFANGTSPQRWRITLDFSSLVDRDGQSVPTNKIRKVRWTYAADLQSGAFARSEFQVVVSSWIVTGTRRSYSVAGPGSRRVEDHDPAMQFNGQWTMSRGNFSGGTVHSTQTQNDSLTCQYTAPQQHMLYIGTRYTANGAHIAIQVDGQAAGTVNLSFPGEDVLVRWPVGQFAAGAHTIVVSHAGPAAADFYFDFVEAAVPASSIPSFPVQPRTTLATDWDTDHSLALAPERTAWLIDTLGFKGRQNHYAGALWFYELLAVGNAYAVGTVTFTGTPDPNFTVSVTLGRTDQPTSSNTVLQKLIHIGDTATTLATAFEQELNRGYTGVWASVTGNVLTIQSRSLGQDGNEITLAVSTTSANLTVAASGATFAGGVDGNWRTDLAATPRMNRAARDWSASFFTALHGYGTDSATAFSMELQHGDPSVGAGIAQLGPQGDPILLPTPSLQTNFSPASIAFWQDVYAEAAALQSSAGMQPYLQFGEVQWWYFPNDGAGNNFSGMPFYDAWSAAQFQTQYGRPMTVFTNNTSDPTQYPDEVAFLAAQIGNFTSTVINHVRATQPQARFEVLYPTDVNQTAFNGAINFPLSSWIPAALTCLKTECFGFTYGRNLDQSEATVRFGGSLGFGSQQRSHLVGIADVTAAWDKEVRIALGRGVESVVLFALDQFCLIGYELPLPRGLRRSLRMSR